MSEKLRSKPKPLHHRVDAAHTDGDGTGIEHMFAKTSKIQNEHRCPGLA